VGLSRGARLPHLIEAHWLARRLARRRAEVCPIISARAPQGRLRRRHGAEAHGLHALPWRCRGAAVARILR
jgi:hypothetical protein